MRVELSFDRDALAEIERAAERSIGGDIFYAKDAIYLEFVELLRSTIDWRNVVQSPAYEDFSTTLVHPIEGWLPSSPTHVDTMPKQEILLRLTHHFANEEKYRGNLNNVGKSGALHAAVKVLRQA